MVPIAAALSEIGLATRYELSTWRSVLVGPLSPAIAMNTGAAICQHQT